ncbi:hypothetical protein, partial [Caballeronia sp. M23-90]
FRSQRRAGAPRLGCGTSDWIPALAPGAPDSTFGGVPTDTFAAFATSRSVGRVLSGMLMDHPFAIG